MDTISYVDLISVSTIKARVILLFLSITIVSLPYAISFTICCISGLSNSAHEHVMLHQSLY